MPKTPENVKIQVTLPRSVWRKLKKAGKEDGTLAVSAMARRLIVQGLAARTK